MFNIWKYKICNFSDDNGPGGVNDPGVSYPAGWTPTPTTPAPTPSPSGPGGQSGVPPTAANPPTGWSWSVSGGWQYNGTSVPTGPTNPLSGEVYDPKKDPALAKVLPSEFAGFKPSNPAPDTGGVKGGKGALPADYQKKSDALYRDIAAAQAAERAATGRARTQVYWSSVYSGAQKEGITAVEMYARMNEGKYPEFAIPSAAPAKHTQTPTAMSKEAEVVELDTGELVSSESFSKLSQEKQALLKELGVEEFNRVHNQEQYQFLLNHVELAAGGFVNKEEFNKLSKEDQHYIDKYGVDKFNETYRASENNKDSLPPVPARFIQEQLKNMEGGDPFKDYRTAEGSYDIARYLRDNPNNAKDLVALGFQQEDVVKAQQDNARRMPMAEFKEQYFNDKGWEQSINRTDAKKEKLVEHDSHLREAADAYMSRYGVGDFVQSGGAVIAGTAFKPAYKSLAPGYSVGDVSPAEWAEGALDVALWVAPFAIAKGIKAARTATLAGKINRIADSGISEMAEVLRKADTTSPALVESFNTLGQAQQKYVSQRMLTRDLEATLSITQGEVRPEIIRSLEQAKNGLDKARDTLKAAARDYADNVRITGQKYDSPIEAKNIERISSDIVRHTDDVIDATINASMKPAQRIAQAKTELVAAQEALTVAKTKYPMDPLKWVELTLVVDRKGGLLKAAQLGNLQNLYNSIIKAREVVAKTEKALRSGDELSRAVIKEYREAQKITITAPKELDSAIKRLENELGGGGSVYRKGRVPVLSPSDGSPSALDTELAKAGYKPPPMGGYGSGGSSSGGGLRATTAEAAAREAAASGAKNPLTVVRASPIGVAGSVLVYPPGKAPNTPLPKVMPAPYDPDTGMPLEIRQIPSTDDDYYIVVVRPHLEAVTAPVKPQVEPDLSPYFTPEPAPYSPGIYIIPKHKAGDVRVIPLSDVNTETLTELQKNIESKTGTDLSSRTGTEGQAKAGTSTSPASASAASTKTSSQSALSTKTGTNTKVSTSAGIVPKLQPGISPAVSTPTSTPRTTPTPAPGPEKTPRPLLPRKLQNKGRTTKEDWEKGTIVWAQGSLTIDGKPQIVRHISPPPYLDEYVIVGKPVNGMINTGSDDPDDTIQVIGGKALNDADFIVGFEVAHVRANRKEINFSPIPKTDKISDVDKARAKEELQRRVDRLLNSSANANTGSTFRHHNGRASKTKSAGKAEKLGPYYKVGSHGLSRQRPKGKLI